MSTLFDINDTVGNITLNNIILNILYELQQAITTEYNNYLQFLFLYIF